MEALQAVDYSGEVQEQVMQEDSFGVRASSEAWN